MVLHCMFPFWLYSKQDSNDVGPHSKHTFATGTSACLHISTHAERDLKVSNCQTFAPLQAVLVSMTTTQGRQVSDGKTLRIASFAAFYGLRCV